MILATLAFSGSAPGYDPSDPWLEDEGVDILGMRAGSLASWPQEAKS